MRRIALVRREMGVLARSPGLWIALVAFAVAHTLGAMLPAIAFDDPAPALGAAFLLGPATDLLLPAIAIVFGHGAIAGRRETGELVQLLALPYGRTELLASITCARIATVGAVAVVGPLPAILAIRIVYGHVSPIRLVGFVLVTAIAGVAYTAVAVAVSAAVRTRLRALGVALGGFVVAHAIWEPMLEAVGLTAVGSAVGDWLDVLVGLNPLDAYGTMADAILPPAPSVALAFGDGGLAADQGAVVGATDPSVGVLVGPGLVLLGWAILPVTLAAARFRRVDLA